MIQIHPHPEWRIVVDLMKAADYGSVFTHVEIARACGLAPQTARYFQQMQKARVVLRDEWNRETESVPGVGYRLVLPPEFYGRARRWWRLSGRPIRAGIKTAIAAPQDRLSDAENAKNADAIAKFGALEAARRKAMNTTRPTMPGPTRPDQPKLAMK